ncbi:MAG: short subunit dehydrogenase-like uncharacterized protein [Lentisphaeria bacterium]
MTAEKYDLIVYGASGFVGKILVGYLANTYGFGGDKLHWAIAGRSSKKLEEVKREVIKFASSASATLPTFIADAGDANALRCMCEQTGVVVSTVGPYSLYGETLVRVCAETGTDYCDLTGEAHWLLQMICKYQQQAQKTGARIVNCCGFDSIPSDLGVYFTQQNAQQNLGQPCDTIHMRVAKLKGTFSGGTYASMLNSIKELGANARLKKALGSPYCLCPSDHSFKTRQISTNEVSHDSLTDSWLTPFVMAGINTRIVHRSNSLLGELYGENFKYDEALVAGKGPEGRKRASKLSFTLKALLFAASISPLRWLLSRFLLPSPGQGPSKKQQDNGAFLFIFEGNINNKGTIKCSVSGDSDPGYGATAQMLGEAAVFLALKVSKTDLPGGFWTPASIFKDKLINVLHKNTGICFKVDKINRK